MDDEKRASPVDAIMAFAELHGALGPYVTALVPALDKQDAIVVTKRFPHASDLGHLFHLIRHL